MNKYTKTNCIAHTRPKISARLRCRIQNVVVDLRCRIDKYLCTTFNVIILPTFPVQQMVTCSGGRRRIRSKTARSSYSNLVTLQIPTATSQQSARI
ncbi:hypothetical protein V1527DRAFT_468207 [Lipomyces starkeyi]